VDTSHQAELLRRWGCLGRSLVRPSRGVYSWTAAKRLTTAAIGLVDGRIARLQRLLKESDRRLDPLADPLRVSFALHRWLAADREEAYSDWLAWTLSQVGHAALVGKLLFGASSPPELAFVEAMCQCDREVWVPTGHEGHTGRLDCVLRFGSEALIVIEVKVVGVDGADTVKQQGYFNWLDGQRHTSLRRPVLLAVHGDPDKEYEGFTLTSWEQFCHRLRALVPTLLAARRLELTTAATILGFVGAVEQNLLELPSVAWLRSDFRTVSALPMLPELQRTADYLHRAMSQEGS
jgi:hypothetical protein